MIEIQELTFKYAEAKKNALTILCEKTGAEPIQFIGRRFVMYRQSRENPRITIE